MAKSDYTVQVLNLLRVLDRDISAIWYLSGITPDEDEHSPLLELLSDQLKVTFSELEGVVIQAVT